MKGGTITMKVSVVRKNGENVISIDGKIYPPLSFKSFRPDERNISEFYNAGVRLFSVLSSGVISGLGVPYSLFGESWVGDGEYDFAPLDRQLDMFIANAPDAYFAPMLQLDTRGWYLRERLGVPNSFTHLSQIAGDEEYRRAAADYMKAFISHCEEKYGDKIYGYFLLNGTTTEWLSDRDYEEPHPIKERAFVKWTGDENAALPTKEELERGGGIFLEPDEANVARARRFHAELISDLILYFAGEAQWILRHEKLLGLYFGYLFELGNERLHNAGHLAYEKVFLSDDIDMIASPASYGFRKQDMSGAFMLTQKTLDAHGKLYFLEFDHRTHTVPERLSEKVVDAHGNLLYDSMRFPGVEVKCRNDDESVNLLWREYILCKASGAALWWFDMFGGWFRSERMMSAIADIIGTENRLLESDKRSAAEVAVFAEGESMYRVRKSCPIATDCLGVMRMRLAECGAPYDLYSISDIFLNGIDRYKVYIFMNEYDIPDETRKRIDLVCKRRGKTVLWMYAPDYAHDGENCAENITARTGIPVTEDDHPHGAFMYAGERFRECAARPYFSTDKDAEGVNPLAYWEDGAVAAAERLCMADGGTFRSVFSAIYDLPSGFLRDVIRSGGAFVYSDEPKVFTYANSAFLGVYNATERDALVSVRRDGVYRDVISGDVFVSEGGKLRLPFRTLRAYMLVPAK